MNMKDTSGIEPEQTITRSAHMSNVPQLITFVCCYAREKGFPENTINEIEVSLKEAISYIIVYAHQENPGEIQISVTIDIRGRLAIVVTDTGKSCNLLLGNNPFFESDTSLYKEKTRVISILRKVFGDIEFKRNEGKNVHSFYISKNDNSIV